MLFMGPQTLLDLFAQFKQSLERVTEALLPQQLPPAPRIPLSPAGQCLRASQSSPCQWLQPDATGSWEGAMALVPQEAAAAAPGGCHITPSLTRFPTELSTLQNLYLELGKRDAPGQSLKGSSSLSSGKSSPEQPTPRAASRKPPGWCVPW